LNFRDVAKVAEEQLALTQKEAGAPSGDGMTLLIFAARLIQQFRFVFTVTNLQQCLHVGFAGTRAADRLPEELWERERPEEGQEWEKNRAPASCQRVEQSLALFPYLHRAINWLNIEAIVPRTCDNDVGSDAFRHA
jgi:hypothetical protein